MSSRSKTFPLFGLLLFAIGFQNSCRGRFSKDEIAIQSTVDFEVKADTSLSVWRKAAWVILPHRSGGRDYRTQFKMLYSEMGIYVLFFCADDSICASLKDDFTNLYNEDVVEAFFWPDETEPLYFEYELSPLNHELPILVPNFNGTFLGWLPWHYEGKRKTIHDVVIADNHSWVASFFLPYSLLTPLKNVPPRKGTTWRCNFYRIDYDEGDSEWSWQLTQTNFHDIRHFGNVVFN